MIPVCYANQYCLIVHLHSFVSVYPYCCLKSKTYLQASSGQESSFVLYFLHNTKHSSGPDSWVGPKSPRVLLICPVPIEVYGKIYPTFSSCEII